MRTILAVIIGVLLIGCSSPVEKRLITEFPRCDIERINSSSTSETYAIYCNGKFVKKETFFKPYTMVK